MSPICKIFLKCKTYEKCVVFLIYRISPKQANKEKFLPQEKWEIHLLQLCE